VNGSLWAQLWPAAAAYQSQHISEVQEFLMGGSVTQILEAWVSTYYILALAIFTDVYAPFVPAGGVADGPPWAEASPQPYRLAE